MKSSEAQASAKTEQTGGRVLASCRGHGMHRPTYYFLGLGQIYLLGKLGLLTSSLDCISDYGFEDATMLYIHS